MRIFLHLTIILIITILFSGCTHTNAFSRFNFDDIKERATSSLRTSKISYGEEMFGVISAIYLNEVKPQKYNGMEYFYIIVYTKDKGKLYDPNILDTLNLNVQLNGKLPVKIKQLDRDNMFKGMIPLNNDWSSYYLVAFNEDEGEKLSLTLQNDYYVSQPLIYQKGEQ